jgi:hypothetical protein
MENKIFEEKQEQEQGWRDVLITPDMPLAAIVQFLNILNQRLCAIEDNLLIELPTGERMSLTKAYQLQAQQEEKAKEEQSKGE